MGLSTVLVFSGLATGLCFVSAVSYHLEHRQLCHLFAHCFAIAISVFASWILAIAAVALNLHHHPQLPLFTHQPSFSRLQPSLRPLQH